MTKFSKHQKQEIVGLVGDCDLMDLKEKEALQYLASKGFDISPRHYYRVKRFLEDDQSVRQWTGYMARVGFARKHRQLYEEIEKLNAQSWRMLNSELEKPESVTKEEYEAGKRPRNNNLIMTLHYDIRENNKRLEGLLHGAKGVTEVKTVMDRLVDDRKKLLGQQIGQA